MSATRPWELPHAAGAGDRRRVERLDAVLAVLLDASRVVTAELRPFLPLAADRIGSALAELDVRQGRALFRKAEPLAR